MSMIPFSFPPTRAAALDRLSTFAPRMGRDYAADRNTDEGPGARGGVSMLSPYLRFRVITEQEVLAATFERFSFASAEKFIQEVFWRAYFKGYLETRPGIWASYVQDLAHREKSQAYENAVAGQTGLECFDAWVAELKTTGYLHNHARMWFASIWMFTLKLPWQLGADFMYRHLIDGDPASNTLSWRWVAGLHTKGKTYLARPDNIARYTNGRFQPTGLASFAVPLEEAETHQQMPVPPAIGQWPEGDFGLLVTTEDMSIPTTAKPTSVAIASQPVSKSGGAESALSRQFKTDALNDAAERFSGIRTTVTRISTLDAKSVLQWCQQERLSTVAVAYAPVGPEADALNAIEAALADHDITLLRVRRRYDSLTWPHSTKGFFALKEKLPAIIEKLGLQGHQKDLF
jgi:deoxyribodipyrimidine photo-lyase